MGHTVVYILHEQRKIYTMQERKKKKHSPCTLQTVSNATTHNT
jgi:hypothetical protein